MKIKFQAFAIAASAAIALTSCGGNNNNGNNSSATISIDGSSTVYPISEAVAEDFRAGNKNVRITVGVSGTGGGFKKFARGETDISNASRTITEKENEACKEAGIEYIELPIAYDGLAIVVNPQNDWAKDITVAELKKIWEPEAQGKIMRWNQIRPEWPNEEIHLFGAGVESGTYDYFTEAVVGKAHSSRGDYTASEDDNVLVQGISTDKNALGFFGVAYYANNKDKLKLLPVDDQNAENGSGPVTPTLETIQNGTYQPLSRPIFIYVNAKSAQRPEVDNFVNYYLTEGPALADEVGYISLPEDVNKLVLERYNNKKTGSMFLGKSHVNVNLKNLLTEAK